MIINNSCKGHLDAGTAVMLDKGLAGFDAELTFNSVLGVFFIYTENVKTLPCDVRNRLDSIFGAGGYMLRNSSDRGIKGKKLPDNDSPCFKPGVDGRPKETEGKPMLSLVPRGINECIARVREYGNKKYGSPNGWKLMKRQDYWEACLRHAEKARNNIDSVDKESGLPHTWHLACDLSFILSGELK